MSNPISAESLAMINTQVLTFPLNKELIYEQMKHAINTAINERDQLITELKTKNHTAYFERNQCVTALCKLALQLGLKAGRAVHPKEDTEWDEDWRHMLFIDLPTGQVSWHIHDTEAWLFDDLPWYDGEWDGHTTPEKYKRVNTLPVNTRHPLEKTEE